MRVVRVVSVSVVSGICVLRIVEIVVVELSLVIVEADWRVTVVEVTVFPPSVTVGYMVLVSVFSTTRVMVWRGGGEKRRLQAASIRGALCPER